MLKIIKYRYRISCAPSLSFSTPTYNVLMKINYLTFAAVALAIVYT